MSAYFQQCGSCAALYFPSRLLCGACGGIEFGSRRVDEGVVQQATRLSTGVHILSVFAAGVNVVASSLVDVPAGRTVALDGLGSAPDADPETVFLPGAVAPATEETP